MSPHGSLSSMSHSGVAWAVSREHRVLSPQGRWLEASLTPRAAGNWKHRRGTGTCEPNVSGVTRLDSCAFANAFLFILFFLFLTCA